MSKQLEYFRVGEPASARKLNLIVDELRRLQQMKGGDDVKVIHSPNGLIIGRERRLMTIDDFYQLDVRRLNTSDLVRRTCDLQTADIADVWRIRATPEPDPNPVPAGIELEALFRLMWFINRSFGGGGHGGEAGWITDAGEGAQKTEYDPNHVVAPPVRRIGQIGDIVILDEGDFLAETQDGDTFCYSNIRHDAHFHLSEAKDGRLFMTLTPAGDLPSGFDIKGELVGDPAVANYVLSELKKESVEWRPQIKIPALDIVQEIYDPVDAADYSFPPVIRVPNSSLIAYDFGWVGKREGWSSHYEVKNALQSYGLGILMKFVAANTQGSPQNVRFDIYWKAINNGGSVNTSVGMNLSSFIIPIPTGSTVDTLRHATLALVPASALSDFTLIACRYFIRNATAAEDTLTNPVLVVQTEPVWTIVPEPPT